VASVVAGGALDQSPVGCGTAGTAVASVVADGAAGPWVPTPCSGPCPADGPVVTAAAVAGPNGAPTTGAFPTAETGVGEGVGAAAGSSTISSDWRSPAATVMLRERGTKPRATTSTSWLPGWSTATARPPGSAGATARPSTAIRASLGVRATSTNPGMTRIHDEEGKNERAVLDAAIHDHGKVRPGSLRSLGARRVQIGLPPRPPRARRIPPIQQLDGRVGGDDRRESLRNHRSRLCVTFPVHSTEQHGRCTAHARRRHDHGRRHQGRDTATVQPPGRPAAPAQTANHPSHRHSSSGLPPSHHASYPQPAVQALYASSTLLSHDILSPALVQLPTLPGLVMRFVITEADRPQRDAHAF
jgi:hypothetical protein